MKSYKLEITAKELQLLSSEKFDTVYFHGKTMLPFLREADELMVIPINICEVIPGDIVTHLLDDKFPTRRVIKLFNKKKIALIQGDSIAHIKFKVPYEAIIGLAIARKRNGKWINNNSFHWKFFSFIILNRQLISLRTKRFIRKRIH